jgi:dihydroorotase
MKNFRVQNIRLVDATQDFQGSLVIEAGYIKAILPGDNQPSGLYIQDDFLPGDENIALMPAFIDLHAHFRDPGFPEKETLESGSQAAAAGGYGTVVCMANTKPVIDTLELARALKDRSDALGLIDLYPALALTKGMQGKSLSAITQADLPGIRLLSEDGQDVDDDALLLQAFQEARRLGLPVSCHCAAKLAGPSQDRRIEENQGVQRVIALGKEAGCRIHIAHVSTKEAVELIRQAKETFLTCEATPHHLRLTKAEADKLGKKGRVNPPLRTEEDVELYQFDGFFG